VTPQRLRERFPSKHLGTVLRFEEADAGRVTHLLDNRLNDYHSLAWMPDGQIVATQQGMRATIWKLTPECK
jgi:hypothetical protein